MHIFEINDSENWRMFESRQESRVITDAEPPLGDAIIRFKSKEIPVTIVKALDLEVCDLWVAHIKYQ